ncbi:MULTISPECIES: GNAT family N-acetyltransferase [unclassified Streptomyces]|uniref:GNAT family N-acetyltransferase n=1 Tax=unclassified Streptomyces TaxID=2593676 RepID=UPI001F043AA1|nr:MULTISPECIES: GNAT family N-acetyltransferase [unclassified Streptomyces]MCH0561619.1 GNAT family N-acetyltransferase [Streptomyces sp. MUM 2J]MCH0568904.1 GNAT family N-acetyltransferase [Streptomyces sp. MUM 136J]
MSLCITPLTDPAHGPHSRRQAWLASDADSIPVGTAFLRLFVAPGQEHLAELTLQVHPAERRRGVGSRLLDAAVAAARENARRCVIAQAEAGSAGDDFATARGFRRVLTLMYSRLALAGVDTTALAGIIARPYPGYRLVSWQGTVPDHLAQTFAASRRAMDDMPMDDTDYGTVTWDVDRVRAAAKAVEERGDRLHTVVAVTTSDDSIAGFTELVVPGNGTGDGQHYGTGVLPEHRGHGLGRWMKAESIRQAHERYPELGGLLTDTASSNTHMRRINDGLGYTHGHTTHQHQFDL